MRIKMLVSQAGPHISRLPRCVYDLTDEAEAQRLIDSGAAVATEEPATVSATDGQHFVGAAVAGKYHHESRQVARRGGVETSLALLAAELRAVASTAALVETPPAVEEAPEPAVETPDETAALTEDAPPPATQPKAEKATKRGK